MRPAHTAKQLRHLLGHEVRNLPQHHHALVRVYSLTLEVPLVILTPIRDRLQLARDRLSIPATEGGHSHSVPRCTRLLTLSSPGGPWSSIISITLSITLCKAHSFAYQSIRCERIPSKSIIIPRAFFVVLVVIFAKLHLRLIQ